METGYDIIGDVHGHAAALENLLKVMGYTKRDGVWCHSERTAAFVGDFVDRGPENLRACRIVEAMQEAGSCVAVMGNHDLNAVCLATPDPASPGEHLRPHTPHNLQQTAATRAEMERDPEETRIVLNWLRQLPLWLELDGLRIVHAGWSLSSMEKLRPWIDERRALTDEGLVRAARKGDPVRHAREMLLNGLEANLPNNMQWLDQESGKERSEVRLPWWLAGDSELTWRVAADLVPNEARSKLPDTPLPEGILGERDNDSRPIFFGHYSMGWELPFLTPIHACVDASIAWGGRLAAYRFSGERELRQEQFVAG